MFTRARLRLTLLYIALMGATLALLAAGITVFVVRETHRTEDQELRLRAEGLAERGVRVGGGGPFGEFRPGDDGDGRPPTRGRGLEREGILTYLLPVVNGTTAIAPPGASASLPDVDAAQAALVAGGGRFATRSLEDGDVRLYSLPVLHDATPVAVVQVARSRSLVQQSIVRLSLIIGGGGGLGLLLSAGAGYWLAGRSLQPIAAAMERQRRFVSDASHELRTPLTLIRGNTELLQRHPERTVGQYVDVVQDVVEECDRLSRLVADLLTLARADEGRLRRQNVPVDLSAICEALTREFQPVAEAKGLELRGVITPGITVRGDADTLRQLGTVLLDNAVRYTTAGTVTLRLFRHGHDADLVVRDTGPGIAPEHLPSIFDRFYRVDLARGSDDGGSGLGLAIARVIADAHGAHIDVSSTPGVGSTFSVRLPGTVQRD